MTALYFAASDELAIAQSFRVLNLRESNYTRIAALAKRLHSSALYNRMIHSKTSSVSTEFIRLAISSLNSSRTNDGRALFSKQCLQFQPQLCDSNCKKWSCRAKRTARKLQEESPANPTGFQLDFNWIPTRRWRDHCTIDEQMYNWLRTLL